MPCLVAIVTHYMYHVLSKIFRIFLFLEHTIFVATVDCTRLESAIASFKELLTVTPPTKQLQPPLDLVAISKEGSPQI